MWTRMSVVLLGGMFLFGTPARGEDLADLLNKGRQAFRGGKYDDAEHYHRPAVTVAESTQLIEKALGPDSVELAPLLNNLASIYAIEKKWDAATTLFGRALFVLQGSLEPDHPVVAGILDSIGGMQFGRNNFAHAERVFRQGYAIRLKVFGPAHPLVATSAVNLAVTLSARGNHGKAERLFADALQVYENALASRSSEVAATLEKLTELLRKVRREEEASAMDARAKDIRFELNSVVGVKALR